MFLESDFVSLHRFITAFTVTFMASTTLSQPLYKILRPLQALPWSLQVFLWPLQALSSWPVLAHSTSSSTTHDFHTLSQVLLHTHNLYWYSHDCYSHSMYLHSHGPYCHCQQSLHRFSLKALKWHSWFIASKLGFKKATQSLHHFKLWVSKLHNCFITLIASSLQKDSFCEGFTATKSLH